MNLMIKKVRNSTKTSAGTNKMWITVSTTGRGPMISLDSYF